MGGDEALPRWTADVPEPEVCVVYEDGRHKGELTSFVAKGTAVKDVRIRGPVRNTRKEALKDCAELRKAAYKGGGTDPALFHVRLRRKELESIKWTAADLVGADVEDKEDDNRKAKEAMQQLKYDEEQKKRNAMSFKDKLSAARGGPSERELFRPVGPNWTEVRAGSLVQLPNVPFALWQIHEKQDSTGKYRAWLFFNRTTGKYYRQKDSGVGYIQTGVPNDPQALPISARIGSANILSKGGKKLNMAVLLPELHKTGFLLKQPLEFLDKPASLFVLCDGLRDSAAGAEFCAKKLHTILLPKLSARATEWEDFELVDVVRDTVDALDILLLDSPSCLSGCSLAVGLLAGTRLVLGALGGVRCVVAQAYQAAQRRSITAPAPVWTANIIAGGDAHTVRCEEERLRIESAGNRISTGVGPKDFRLCSGSARPCVLAAVADERERLLLQVARAATPCAALGLTVADLKGGAATVRSTFRKRSLVVHPDKVGDAQRERAVSVFAKLEQSATALETMVKTDAAAATMLAEIDAAHDAGLLFSNPSVAAKLLGVEEGCSEKTAKQALKNKFHPPLFRLQNLCQKDVDRALKTLDVAVETVVRGTTLWSPPEAVEAVQVTRALGCKDLKYPVPLLSSGLAAECIDLEPGKCVGVALLSDALRSVSETDVARLLALHSPARPRAAALRIALQGTDGNQGLAAGAICAYFDYDSASKGSGSSGPAAKRAKTAATTRVRISHILLRWAGMRCEDEFARQGMEIPERTQAAAEKELLELLEELTAGDPKTLGSRFKAQVLKRSECATALNVPYADLGWIEQGGAEAPLEAAAFATPIEGISDVVVSTRGAHLMYRLA